MSFILKALKKLESEKVAGKAEPVEINMALLAPENATFAKPRMRGKWAVVSLLLLVCAGIIFFFMNRPSSPPNEAGKALPPLIATAPAAPPAQVAAPPVQPVAPAAPAPAPAANTGSATGATSVSPAPIQPKAEGRRPASARARSSASPRSEPEPMAQSYGGSPALTVSGIAYQDNPADSMAVVNGALVKSGMSVGGVQVERIFVDRVRFRRGGGTFEVPLAR